MDKKYRVPKSAITERGLKKLIRDAAKDHASVSEWAVANGITPQAVSAFFRKTQGPGIKIPEVFGYRPQVIYLPLDERPVQLSAVRKPVIKAKPVKESSLTERELARKRRDKQKRA